MSEYLKPNRRLNVALIPKADQALVRLQERTALSEMDLINRALQVYEFVEAEQRAGGTIMVRDADNHCQDVKIT